MSLLLDAIQDYGIVTLDLKGMILTWNTGAERCSGFRREEMVGRHFRYFFPEEHVFATPNQPLDIASSTGRFETLCWQRRRDDSRFWARFTLTPIRLGPEIAAFAGVTRDLSDRLTRDEALDRAEARLQDERDRLRVTLRSIGDGVISIDASGNVLFLNPVAEAMTGWNLEDAFGRPAAKIFHLGKTEDGLPQQHPVEACLSTGTVQHIREGSSMLSRNGHMWAIEDSVSPIFDRKGVINGAVLVFQDVTHMRQVQTELRHQMLHDALTGLPNRKQLEISLRDAISDAENRSVEHALSFLDLDRFKIINDTAGHAVGDLFLRSVTNAIRRCLRDSDLVARLGGDEFAILLFDCKLDEANALLKRVAECIARIQFRWEGHVYQSTVSIGVATINANTGSASHVMKQADVACYSAKRAGRNRVTLYCPGQAGGDENHRELHMAAEIGEALAGNRFVLFAQKILPLGPDTHTYCEILLRMVDHDGSFISPSAFIPAAERYDLMLEVDRWVLREILGRLGSELMLHPNLVLSINLSAHSLNDPGFLAFFLDLLTLSGVPSSRLILEITETALINNLATASTVVEQLRLLGCRVALDDFGAGLSSFSYLRSFRVDLIKIEGRFVRNMLENPVDLTIVRSINQIAHELHTVAEFVEDQDTADMLKTLGIDFGQGYALGRPEPIMDLLNRPNA
ncbi:EAL domain-containing protein [Granulicella sibirica]|uniref:Diguanylate cyclase/phosphodiesterase (GGDEF & EAL domains) with PAS/PAC sensor(S) n=1 Tax=Granulicella sibirica TaxID=2479048 RepID=A0A4V1L6B6_9BACT|nr:EAL domain-containing protein [Granulicella sibirica]RXH58694.1 diguanylate cyclase/phosphodiesterase (GGDEF & EAL domains) with PAS/PAC sensor(s) [Granulicella sibirica]